MADYDVGATILEIVDPIKLAFELAGSSFANEVTLATCDPLYNVALGAGYPGALRPNRPHTLEVATPLDFERRLLAPEGAFLGLSMERSCHRPFSGPQRGL